VQTLTEAIKIEQLLARLEIEALLVRYCRGVDRCDVELMKSCFHPGAIDDHGFFSGPADIFAEQAAQNLPKRFSSTKHFLTNVHLELAGDHARSESYVLALFRMDEAGLKSDMTISARYLDVIERRNGEWKIAHRTLVNDETRIDRVEREDMRLGEAHRSGRKDDLSYAFLARMRPAAPTKTLSDGDPT
jgi:hypothetical protein